MMHLDVVDHARRNGAPPEVVELIASQFRFKDECLSFLQASTVLLELEHATVAQSVAASDSYIQLLDRLRPVYGDVHHYFMCRLFLSLVSDFECCLQGIVSAVIQRHPKKAGKRQFTLAQIIDAGDLTSLVRLAINSTLNDLTYKKPVDYRNDIVQLLSIDESILNEHWPIFVEAKARRDLGVHASWTCNETYIRKLKEADIPTQAELGDNMIPCWSTYLRQVGDSLHTLADRITLAVLKKHWDWNVYSDNNRENDGP